MSVKDGKDYLYLIWKCSSNRRQYIVGQLSKNGQYEFCYCEEFNEAVKEGFSPLISFEDTNEYSRAMKSHFRKFGNQMSGSGNHLCNYASLLA